MTNTKIKCRFCGSDFIPKEEVTTAPMAAQVLVGDDKYHRPKFYRGTCANGHVDVRDIAWQNDND